MHVARSVILVLAISSSAAAQTPAAAPSLDYEFFKTRVQPIFLAERPGHARCIACHGSGTPMRLQPLAAGPNDVDRRGVAQELRRRAADGRAGQREEPAADASARRSGRRRLLSQRRQALELAERPRVADAQGVGDGRDARHARAPSADHPDQQRRRQRARHRSGDQHGRRRHPRHRGRPRRRRLARTAAASTSATKPRARSTSSTPKSLAVVKKIPLSGHPNNMAVSKDGRRVYVGIIQEPGGVDVIDTASMQRVKTIPTQGHDSQRLRHAGRPLRRGRARSPARRSTSSTRRPRSRRGR